MALLKQSTAYTRMFLMVLTSDHVSPATGKTVTVNLSKAGAAFGAAGGAIAEVANGWYKVSLTTTDTNTLNDLAFNCTASLCDPTDFSDQVIALDVTDAVRAGMTALPNAAAAAANGLPVLGTNATAISFTAGMTISSTTGDALTLSSSGGNGDGLQASGNGTGAGINCTGGATGNGILSAGGATSGSAIKATGTAGNAIALELAGQGSAAGLSATGGATGIGITAVGGATSGSGIKSVGTAGNAIALELAGQGSAAGLQVTGGATGSGAKLIGGGTSGHGLAVTTTSGDGFNLTPTAGNGITATANGTSKHGIVATGGTAGTSDGASYVAGTGGVDLRANQTGNVTGNLSGSVGSVTGAVGSVTGSVGSVTGAVGSVTGAVGSVTGNVGGNVVGSTASVTGAVGSVTGAVGSVTGNVGGSVASVTAAVSLSTSDSPVVQSGTAQAGGASTITLSSGASATDNLYNGQTVKTIAGAGPGQVRVITGYVGSTKVATVDRAWATNPDVTTTYAVLATDLGKTNSSLEVVSASVTGAVGSVTGAVASVTGNVGGNVVGSVGSVIGAVGSVTGNVGGSTASVTGAVGSVTGSVGSVTGAVGSVTARVTANADQWAGTTIPAPAVTGVPKVDLVDIAGATVSTSSAQLGVNAVQIGAAVPGSATIGTVTTTTTATNLTNAPTSGDLTSTMKTSVENAVWDAARSSHLATGVFGQLGQEILRDNTATAGAASTITLDASASTTVDQYKGDVLYIYSGLGSGQSRVISAYSAGRVATVVPAWVTTPDNTSKFIILAQRTPLVGTDARVLTSADVSTSGETVAAVTGSVGSVTGAVGSVTGSVGSVTGAVGSVTGNVGGNVVGSTASVTGAVGSVTGSVGSVTGAVGSVTAGVTVTTNNDKTGYRLSATGIDDVWDEATSGHTTAGTTGKALIDAGSAGDPWGTALPGSYGAGTAGSILGTNLDAAVSTRSSHSAADVWAVGTRTLTAFTIAVDITSAAVSSIWDKLLTGITTASTIGKLIKDNLDAAISSRSTYAGADTSGTTTLLSRLTSGRATLLDNLDATVSSRSTYAGGAVASVTAAVSLSANDSPVVHSGTAQAGGASTITLEATASATDDLYKGQTIKTTGGVGPSQVRTIIGYVGSTNVTTVDHPWATNPDLTTTYAVLATDNPKLDSSLRTTDVNSANLDAAVSSRSTYAGTDTSGTTTLLGRLTSTRAGNLDDLDAAISTRSSHSAADVWAVGTRTLTAFTIAVDLTTAAVSSIWDKLLTGITTASSIGKLIKDNLDATVSSRSTYAGGAVASVTAGVTVTTNNDKTGYQLSAAGVDDVWDEPTSGHTTTGTTGKALIDAGAVGSDPWLTALPGSYGAGTAGSILGTNLDAAVSSRSTYAGADTAGTTTLLGRLTSGRAADLDNLDVAVSTRSSHSAADVWAVGTRTLTAFTIAVDITSAAVSSIWDKLLTGITTASTIGKLIKDNLDAAISTRLAASGYTAPDNSDITAIKAKTDNLPASPAAVSDIPSAAANGSATWDAVRTSHTTAGTFGQGAASVQGNVTGSVASVTADVGITQTAADKAWGTTTRALTDKSGFALTSAYDPAKTAAQAGDAMALTVGERDSVAEAALKLDWTDIVGEASRSTLNALRFLRNKWGFVGTTLTVTKEDDTATAWDGEVTTSGSAQPITSVDPS